MGDSAIIEVAVGMIFIFILLSIIVTQVNTIMFNLLNTRAKNLKEELDTMISNRDVRQRILRHPLINLVEDKVVGEEGRLKRLWNGITSRFAPISRLYYRFIGKTQVDAVAAATPAKGEQITKIDALARETFVDVLIDTLADNTVLNKNIRYLFGLLTAELDKLEDAYMMDYNTVKRIEGVRESVNKVQFANDGAGLSDLYNMVSLLPDSPNRKEVLRILYDIETVLRSVEHGEQNKLVSLFLGIRNLPKDSPLRKKLETMIQTADTLNEAQDKLGKWFDDGMFRATEVFRRRSQFFSLGVGMILAIMLNVDALHLARTLWEDPALRGAVAATAIATVDDLEQQYNQSNPATREEAIAEARTGIQNLLELRLPIGWINTNPADLSKTTDVVQDISRLESRNLWMMLPWNNGGWLGWWLQKIVGLTLTTVAIAQGAPFWFDIMRRIRGSSGPIHTIEDAPKG